MITVNTNQGAMVALNTLNHTSSELSSTQNRVSTGLKVASAKDNGAVWAIANKMKSDVNAYDRVIETNDRATALVDTAVAAGESMMELLNEMKGKALAGTQTGLSASAQGALDADFTALRDQITAVVNNASFDGVNLIKGTPDDAVALGDAAGTSANNITVAGKSLALGGATITVAGTDDVSDATKAAASLTKVNASITNLGTQLATWGSGAKRLEVHKTFVSKLQTALSNGVGSLVDADLAKESAKMQSLQVKQQLGMQSLSMANQSAQSALSLFR